MKFEMIKCATAVACPQEQITFSHTEYNIEEYGPPGFKIKISHKTKKHPPEHKTHPGEAITTFTSYLNVPYWKELNEAQPSNESANAEQPGRPGRKPKAA